jgi:sRNA-binding protein
VKQYAASDKVLPEHLPSALTRDDRACLHHLAERLGLAHESTGELHEKHMVISRKAGATAAAPTRAQPATSAAASPGGGCDVDWETRRVKYDPRHW